ncbi:MAG: hypothetical protein EA365_08790 [Gloeocapsa sp. DLM2.Bin57]|nr:MAG: hypothetical protein EA365_08790 [Gloeocapsa sp. DLM2.Bin57]
MKIFNPFLDYNNDCDSLSSVTKSQSLEGREAFNKALEVLGDRLLVVKVGTKIAYRLEIEKAIVKSVERRIKVPGAWIWATRRTPSDVWQWLEDQSLDLANKKPSANLGNGVFWLLSHGDDLTKDSVKGREWLTTEFDSQTPAEQQAIIDWFTTQGLEPTLDNHSGGKSRQESWKLSRILPIAEATQLARKLALICGGDPAVTLPQQVTRFPGFSRVQRQDGVVVKTQQTIEQCSGVVYTPEEFESKLIKLYESKGLVYPPYISDDTFRVIKRRWSEFTAPILTPEASSALNELLAGGVPSLPRSTKNNKSKIAFNDQPIKLTDSRISKLLDQAIAFIGGRVREDNTYSQIWLPIATALKQILGATQALIILSSVGGKETDWAGILSTAQSNYFSDPVRVIFAKAKELGFNLKEASRDVFKQSHNPIEIEPPRADYQAYIANEQYQELINQAIADYGEQEQLEYYGASFDSFWEQIETALWVESTVAYSEQVDIWFRRGERHRAYLEAKTQGYKYILDASRTGTGKDYDNSLRFPELVKVQNEDGTTEEKPISKIWFLDSDYKNKDKDFETWAILEPRHNGLYEDHSRTTDTGKPYLVVEPKVENQTPIVSGNCDRAPLFGMARSKGVPDVDKSGKHNPLCAGCAHFQSCKSVREFDAQDTGYGYIGTRAKTIEESARILAHAQNLPRNYDYSKDTLIVNEAGNTLNLQTPAQINSSDWDKAYALAMGNTELTHGEKDVLTRIHQLKDSIYGDTSKHGLDLKALRELLQLEGIAPETLSTLQTKINHYQQGVFAELLQSLQDLDSVTLSEAPNISAASLAIARSAYKRSQVAAALSKIKDFPPYFLGDLIGIIWLQNQGFASYRKGILTVTTRDDSLAKILSQAKQVTLLDSTLTKERAARLLGIKPDEICVVAQDEVSTANLNITRFELGGDNSNSWSDSYLDRLALLEGEFLRRFPQGKVIVPKRLGDILGADMTYMSQTRGANRFKGCHMFIKPVLPDVGAIKTDFYLEYPNGSDNEFEQYYKQRILDELIQTIGRNRWHWYREQELHVWLCLPEKISAKDIVARGLPCETKPVAEYCLEAAPLTQQKVVKVFQSICQQVKKGVKVTQEFLASRVGVHQSNISRLLKQLNYPLKDLTKLCKDLYITIKRKRIISDPPPPELMDICEAIDLDPLWVVALILEEWETNGFKFTPPTWLTYLNKEYREKLWAIIMTSFIAYRVNESPPWATS